MLEFLVEGRWNVNAPEIGVLRYDVVENVDGLVAAELVPDEVVLPHYFAPFVVQAALYDPGDLAIDI